MLPINQNEKNEKKFYGIVLMFIPIFFSQSGIFLGVISENGIHLGETGLILPLIFFVSIYATLVVLLKMIKGIHIQINKILFFLILFIVFYTTFISLIGYGLSQNFIVLLRCAQFLTFTLGIFLFYYVKLKNINLANFLKSLFYFLLILMILHFLSSFIEIGINTTFQGISPNIFFFGVYQSRVYYPYLITTLLFLSLISIKNPYVRLFATFVLGIYIFTLQVRGALISFFLYLFVYLILYVRNKVILSLSFVLFLIFMLSNDVTIELGRFGDFEKIFTFNGRISIWLDALEVSTLSQLIFGNLFFDPDQISAHNQYLQFFQNGGIILLLSFILLAMMMIKLFIQSVRSKDKQKIYISFVFIVPLIIDLNLNVPLNNINSTIIYTFVWLIASKIILHKGIDQNEI